MDLKNLFTEARNTKILKDRHQASGLLSLNFDHSYNYIIKICSEFLTMNVALRPNLTVVCFYLDVSDVLYYKTIRHCNNFDLSLSLRLLHDFVSRSARLSDVALIHQA